MQNTIVKASIKPRNCFALLIILLPLGAIWIHINVVWLYPIPFEQLMKKSPSAGSLQATETAATDVMLRTASDLGWGSTLLSSFLLGVLGMRRRFAVSWVQAMLLVVTLATLRGESFAMSLALMALIYSPVILLFILSGSGARWLASKVFCGPCSVANSSQTDRPMT